MALLLKDYLELQPSPTDFSSPSAYSVDIPIHRLIEAELAHFHNQHTSKLFTSLSKNALAKLSTIFCTIKHLPFSSSNSGDRRNSAMQSFLSRKFWKKRPQKRQQQKKHLDESLPLPLPVRVRVRDIVRQRSFGDEGMKLVIDSISSCSSSSSSSESEFAGADHESFSPSIASCDSFDAEMSAVAGDGCEEKKCCNSNFTVVVEKEEKELVDCESENEQLSPVSVMDFPSEKEEEEEEEGEESATMSNSSSPSFHRTLTNIERSKLQLLQNIRRFESFAELNAVNLSHCFEHLDDSCSSSSHEEALDLEQDDDLGPMGPNKAWALLEELKSSNYLSVGPMGGSVEKFLVDFFNEGLCFYDRTSHGLCGQLSEKFVLRPCGEAQVEVELSERAKSWIQGDEEEVYGEASIREMERNGGWKCLDEEKEMLGLDLEGFVFGSLLEELLGDLASSQYFCY